MRLGVPANTAQCALAALREAGLVATVQRRAGAGRFGASVYRLTVDANVLSRQSAASRTVNAPALASHSRVAAKPAVNRGEQLMLLPSA